MVLDDFHLTNQKEKDNLLQIINVVLRHNQITLFLIIHNLYSNKLFNQIIIAPHIILAYSTLGDIIIR